MQVRNDFEIYHHHPKLLYFDSAATALKPKVVLEAMNQYYNEYGVNVHRGVYHLGYVADQAFQASRQTIAQFINADASEIVFTRNTTESLNMLALMLEHVIAPGDEIITSELEHHSSLLPWMQVAQRKNAKLVYIPLNEHGRITVDNFKKVVSKKTKIVALTHVSNVMGYITPLEDIIPLAHQHGALVIVDAAQSVPHFKVDVKQLDCDFLAFSGHKMMGPTGIGVLYGKRHLLKQLDPVYWGGDMNEDVGKDYVEVKDIPSRFEAGTPAIAEIIGLARAVKYIGEIGGIDAIHVHDQKLRDHAREVLSNIPGITVYNLDTDIATFSFNINGVHPHDAITYFDRDEVCMRAGHHCAQLVTKWLQCNGTLRMSLYIYNTCAEIDRFGELLREAVQFFQEVGF